MMNLYQIDHLIVTARTVTVTVTSVLPELGDWVADTRLDGVDEVSPYTRCRP
jgi:hypothetical protein